MRKSTHRAHSTALCAESAGILPFRTLHTGGRASGKTPPSRQAQRRASGKNMTSGRHQPGKTRSPAKWSRISGKRYNPTGRHTGVSTQKPHFSIPPLKSPRSKQAHPVARPRGIVGPVSSHPSDGTAWRLINRETKSCGRDRRECFSGFIQSASGTPCVTCQTRSEVN